MADGDARAPEGWRVPQRRALWLALAVPLLLALAVWGAGRLYDRHLRPRIGREVTTFPAPGIETYIHDGRGDPERPMRRATPDPAIEAAKRSVVATGLDTGTAR